MLPGGEQEAEGARVWHPPWPVLRDEGGEETEEEGGT